jgi:antitoxin component YwqK of YwqJK toxin-antitoxin module
MINKGLLDLPNLNCIVMRKMRICITLSMVLIALLYHKNCSAQEIVKDSTLTGYLVSGTADKYFVPKGKMKKGQKIGFWEDYDVIDFYYYTIQKGIPFSQPGLLLIYATGEYCLGKRTGPWKFYCVEDDTFDKLLIGEYFYTEDTLQGNYNAYYITGEKAESGTYKNGLIQDNRVVYYQDGNIYCSYHYIDNLREGEQHCFYSSGIKKISMSFLSDTLNGEYIQYYPDGTLKEIITYKSGQMDGVYQYYHTNGNLWVERIYQANKLFNVTQLFDKNGNSLEKGTFKDGNGTLNYYDENGTLYLVQTYKNGVVISEQKKK